MSLTIESSPELTDVINILALGRLTPTEREALARFDNLCQILEKRGLYPQDSEKQDKLFENCFKLIPHLEKALERHNHLVGYLSSNV